MPACIFRLIKKQVTSGKERCLPLIKSAIASSVLKPQVPTQTTPDRQTMEEAYSLLNSCELEGPDGRKRFNSHSNCPDYLKALRLALFLLHQHEEGFPRALTPKTKQNTSFFPKQNANTKLHSERFCLFSRCLSTILFDLGNITRQAQASFQNEDTDVLKAEVINLRPHQTSQLQNPDRAQKT